jgi:hypothetical protein
MFYKVHSRANLKSNDTILVTSILNCFLAEPRVRVAPSP